MIKRVGSVIGLPEENYRLYKKAHNEIWPEIVILIKECNIKNYSIFYRDGLLFSYFEYSGDDFEKDMEKIAFNLDNQRWCEFVKPFQKPLKTCKKGEWWAEMKQVFFLE